MTDTDFNDRYGRRPRIIWYEKNRRPLDRWGRGVEEVREHAAYVAGLIVELCDLAGRCKGVLLGREVGPKFERRFDANIAGLERVRERDRWYAECLEEAEAQQRAYYSGGEVAS